MHRTAPLLLAALLVLSACGEDPTAAPPDDGAVDEPGTPEPLPDEDPVPDDPAPDDPPPDDPALGEAAQAATRDAAAEAGVDPDEVEVVTVEQVTWPDGALGCPQPDRMYTQALVEGYRILVEVEGRQVHYHGADGQPPFRCDDPRPPLSG